MPDNIINKANSWGSAISTWTKIIIGLIIFIIGVGTTYYKIESNASTNIRQDSEVKEVLEVMKREFEIWGQRSDKRYQRAMEEAKELKRHDDSQDDKVLELIKDIEFIKGRMYEQDKN